MQRVAILYAALVAMQNNIEDNTVQVLENAKNTSIVRGLLYHNIRYPNPLSDPAYRGSSCVHPVLFLTKCKPVYIKFTELSEHRHRYFESSIGVSMCIVDTNIWCNDIELNLKCIYTISRDGNVSRIEPKRNMTINHECIPVIFHESISDYNHSKPFSLEALYIMFSE